jgi:hypothetical protein
MSKLEPRQASPSWLYRFLDWADRSPITVWGAGILYFVLAGLILYLGSWFIAGGAPHLSFQFFFPGLYMPILLIFWHATNSFASNSINSFAHGVGKTSKQIEEIYTDFVSVKGRVVWLLVLLAIPIGIYYVNGFIAAPEFSKATPIALLYLVVLPTCVVQTLMMFRLLRQLFLLNFHYKSVKDINLFNLGPIYALTGYGYNLAFFGILLVVAIDIVDLLQGNRFDLANNMVSVILVVVLFVSPTLGISRRIRAEKTKDLRDLGTQLNGLYDETSAAVRGRKLDKVPSLNSAAIALERQIEKVQKVATWPWNPGSLRNLLLPIMLPLAVAILQRYVLTALGF